MVRVPVDTGLLVSSTVTRGSCGVSAFSAYVKPSVSQERVLK